MVARRFPAAFAVVVLAVGGLTWSVWAQQSGDNNPPRRGGGGFDPAEFQKRMVDRMKETLKSTDEEWKAIGPRVEKVMAVSRDARGGGMGGFFGGRGGPGGPGGRGPGGRGQDGASDQPQSAISKAASELRTALDDEKASKDDISKKLGDYRSAKEKSRDELVKAQKDLKELLTFRQEATLVLMGIID